MQRNKYARVQTHSLKISKSKLKKNPKNQKYL
jgi:hypothetical protein